MGILHLDLLFLKLHGDTPAVREAILLPLSVRKMDSWASKDIHAIPITYSVIPDINHLHFRKPFTFRYS